jgi:aspartate/methionine/tyrosine aminotransferase
VVVNRTKYQEKYNIADRIFAHYPEYEGPQAGFFLWLRVRDGEEAAKTLWQRTGIRVLPGAYLAQGEGAQNPGQGFIRVALVEEDHTKLQTSLEQLRDCMVQEGHVG